MLTSVRTLLRRLPGAFQGSVLLDARGRAAEQTGIGYQTRSSALMWARNQAGAVFCLLGIEANSTDTPDRTDQQEKLPSWRPDTLIAAAPRPGFCELRLPVRQGILCNPPTVASVGGTGFTASQQRRRGPVRPPERGRTGPKLSRYGSRFWVSRGADLWGQTWGRRRPGPGRWRRRRSPGCQGPGTQRPEHSTSGWP